MATDGDDEYGDEWEAEQAEDAGDEVLGAGSGGVHPLEPLGKPKGHTGASPTFALQEMKHPLGLLGREEDNRKARATTKMTSSSATGSEDDAALLADQINNEELELPRSLDHSQVLVEISSATKHTQHYKSTKLIPPPPPISAQREPSSARESDKVSSAALYAQVAAIRITEYREMARRKEQTMRREEAELAQRRRYVRRSNKPIYESYGVANLTPQERLCLTVRALKKQAKQSERAADEQKNRWYNKQAVRRGAASEHAQQLSSKERGARRKQERLARDAIARIRSNQEHLKQESKTRVAKNTCEYVRGSYLLQAPPSNTRATVRPKTDSSRDATAFDTANE